jgi:hypothetical protein
MPMLPSTRREDTTRVTDTESFGGSRLDSREVGTLAFAAMRTRLRSLAPVLVSLLLLAACDKKADEKKTAAKADKADKSEKTEKKQADEPVKAGQPEPPKTADVLTLGAAKLTATDKPDEVITIAADGTVTVAGEILVKISSDGKLSKPDGTVIGEVGADGIVKFEGKPSGITLIDGGASVTTPDGKTATLRFGEDGALVVDPKPEQGPDAMTSEGCTGPTAKTCALVLMMIVLRSEPSPNSGPTAVEVPADPAIATPTPTPAPQ